MSNRTPSPSPAGEWATVLDSNPFTLALEVVRTFSQKQEQEQAQKGQPQVKEEEDDERGQARTEPMECSREDLKMQAIMRAFEQQAAKEERRRKMLEIKREREATDPCKCGRSRARRLPKPLSAGAARCNACTPLTPSRKPPSLREAPLFHPTEEEFADPMRYIASIQAEAYEYGIFRIQPPPSWKPPAAFHWRQNPEEAPAADDADADADDAADADADASASAAPTAAAPTTSAATAPPAVSPPTPETADGASDRAEGTEGEEGEEGQEVVPVATKQRSYQATNTGVIDYRPITNDHDFFARLQSVKARR